MNFTPPQVTPANEVTRKQPRYKLFLVEGTSPSDTGPAEEQGVN